MPRVNEVILDKLQVGKESSRGVYVNPTRILPMRTVLNYNKPLAAISEQTGTFAGRRTPVKGRTQAGLTGTDIGTFEDLVLHFLMALRGTVTGVTDAETPPGYTWEFVPSLSVDDLVTISAELGDPGNKYKMAQLLTNSWTIRMDGDSADEPAWMYETELLARSFDTLGAFTGALTSIDREAILAPGTQVFIDDAGDAIGTTPITGKVINASITGNNAAHLKGFLEDEGSFGADSAGRGERTFDAQITMEFDDDDEFANYRSDIPVERLIRLYREGSEISTGVNKSAALDIAGYWSSFSPGDREGNKILTLGLAAYFDEELGYDFSATVVNGLSNVFVPA